MLRKTAAVLLLVSFLLIPQPLKAETHAVLVSVTATGASVETATYNRKLIRAQVWSDAGSVATIVIQASSSPTAPWKTIATIADPTVDGEYWAVPRTYRVRLNVTFYTSGTIQGNIETYTD